MPNYLSRMKPNGANGTEYKLKDEELREVVSVISDDIKGTQTATGNPITLTDGSETYAQGLSVELEPKQDLHGQSAPYVGGAGKNKLPLTVDGIKAANTSGTWSGNVYSLNNVTFTIESDDGGNVTGISFSTGSSGASANTTLEFFLPEKSLSELELSENDNLILSGSPSGGGTTRFFLRFQAWGTGSDILDYGNGAQGTIDSNSPRKGNIFVRSGYQGQNISFKPMLRLSTETDPTFAPYSNICPISGYDGVEVEDVGVNQWDEEWENGYYNVQTGDSVSDANYVRSKNANPINIEPQTEYCAVVNGNYPFVNDIFTLLFYDENGTYLSYTDLRITGGLQQTFTTPQNARKMRFYLTDYYGATYNHDISINYPSTDTNYHPYQSRTASVTFGQTVYGGKSDFTDGGTDEELDIVDLGTLNWSYDSSQSHPFFYTSDLTDAIKRIWGLPQPLVACECYRILNLRTNAGDAEWANASVDASMVYHASVPNYVYIRDDRFTDPTAFKAAVSGMSLVYEKATPTTISTPPSELKLLKGTNNITTNGTTITLDYIPNNSIGDAVKASEEYTDRAVEGKADNTTAYVDLPGNYDTTNKNFPTRSATSGSVENCLTYINDLADKLYTAINSHATALANIPSKTVLYDDVVEVSDEFNISIPSSYNYLIFELNISSSSYYGTGSLIVTSWDNTLDILVSSHESELRTCTLMFNQNRVEVGGDFDQEIGELKITAF